MPTPRRHETVDRQHLGHMNLIVPTVVFVNVIR